MALLRHFHFAFHSSITHRGHPGSVFPSSSSFRFSLFRQFVTRSTLIPSFAAISRRFTIPSRKQPNNFSTSPSPPFRLPFNLFSGEPEPCNEKPLPKHLNNHLLNHIIENSATFGLVIINVFY